MRQPTPASFRFPPFSAGRAESGLLESGRRLALESGHDWTRPFPDKADGRIQALAPPRKRK